MPSGRQTLQRFLSELLHETNETAPSARPLYLWLLTAACDTEDLVQLHNLLPVQCQLRAADLPKLQYYYKSLWGEAGRGGQTLPERLIRATIAELSYGVILSNYYYEQLRSRRLARTPSDMLYWIPVSCNPLQNIKVFTATIGDDPAAAMEIGWRLQIPQHEEVMRLQIFVRAKQMTRPGVDHLLERFQDKDQEWRREKYRGNNDLELLDFYVTVPKDPGILGHLLFDSLGYSTFPNAEELQQVDFCQAAYALFKRVGLRPLRVGSYTPEN